VKWTLIPVRLLASLLCCWLVLLSAAASAAQYQSHQLAEDALHIRTDQGPLRLRFLTEQAVEVAWEPVGLRQLPSFSIAPEIQARGGELQDRGEFLIYQTGKLAVALLSWEFIIVFMVVSFVIRRFTNGWGKKMGVVERMSAVDRQRSSTSCFSSARRAGLTQ